MSTRSHAAATAGVLFIVATVFFIVGEALYAPVLSAPDYQERASPVRTTVIAGALVGLVGVLAIPLIPAFLFPILRRNDEEWALVFSVGVVFPIWALILNALLYRQEHGAPMDLRLETGWGLRCPAGHRLARPLIVPAA